VLGQALSIISVSLLAVEKISDISPLFFTGVLEVRPQICCFPLNNQLLLPSSFTNTFDFFYMFQAVVAALFMNIYIVGLNQLSDVEIDKV